VVGQGFVAEVVAGADVVEELVDVVRCDVGQGFVTDEGGEAGEGERVVALGVGAEVTAAGDPVSVEGVVSVLSTVGLRWARRDSNPRPHGCEPCGIQRRP